MVVNNINIRRAVLILASVLIGCLVGVTTAQAQCESLCAGAPYGSCLTLDSCSLFQACLFQGCDNFGFCPCGSATQCAYFTCPHCSGGCADGG
jgi:hypothetical protein